MGFWDKVVEGIEGFVRAASAVGNSIIRATKATIDFVYDTATQVANKVQDAARGAFKSLVKDVETIIDGAGNIITKLITKPIEMWAQIKKSWREANRSLEADAATAEHTDNKILNDIFILSRGLKQKAEEIKNDPRMQIFNNFARLRVSMIFLEDLLSKENKLTSQEEVNIRFLEYINMFLADAFPAGGQQLKEFDELIRKIYNKSLLVIGSEVLVDFWKSQEKELQQKLGKKTLEIAALERNIKKMEAEIFNKLSGFERLQEELIVAKNNLGIQTKKRNNLYKECEDNQDMGGVSEGLVNILNSGGKINPILMQKGEAAGEILIRWKNGITPSSEEMDIIREFNLASKAENESAGTSANEASAEL